MKILVLDNYDSFTYNLVQCVYKAGQMDVDIFRNDAIEIDAIEAYDKIILSPGPGLPDEAGILKAVIKRYAPSKSILGVCLGQQAIAEVYGGKLINLDNVFHGVATTLTVKDASDILFKGLPNEFLIGRYHSWVVARDNFPGEFNITAEDENGQIMAIKHKKLDAWGVQFHPESILTEHGDEMIANFLNHKQN